jgi:hypothetical protein
VPPHGLLGSLLSIALTNPVLHCELAWAQTLGPPSVHGRAVRRALFSDNRRDTEVRGYFERLEPESTLVLFDLLGLDLPPSLLCLDLPVLVLGAEHDGFLPAFSGALEATASRGGLVRQPSVSGLSAQANMARCSISSERESEFIRLLLCRKPKGLSH